MIWTRFADSISYDDNRNTKHGGGWINPREDPRIKAITAYDTLLRTPELETHQ